MGNMRDKKGMQNEIFIDWITASQFHPEGGLPVLSGGIVVQYDATGIPRFERNQPASITGSHDSRIRIGCDGYRVSLSGNAGRFSRQNNLYNYNWEFTKKACNRILLDIGLPAFTTSKGIEGNQEYRRGAVVSRLDITANYRCSTELRARSVIAFLTTKSFARMRKGHSGDESVWWANTRHMIKAYIKHIEMLHHGIQKDDPSYLHALENAIVRVELELKKRTLSELKLNDWGDISQEKLECLFRENTTLLNGIDAESDIFTIEAIPIKSRIYASAWLAGKDVKSLSTNGTFYRHAKILREYGIDITEIKNVKILPVKTRFIDLIPLKPPDWYAEQNEFKNLKVI